MVLDFLPYKQPQKPRKEKLGVLRYVMFALSLALVSGLFLMKVANLEQIMFWLFLAGNTLYYIAGIALAFAFKDNRAFCKYLCPITVFLKPMSFFSLLRVHCDESKCVHCGKCLRVCPMNVEVNKESRKRKNGTECILCYEMDGEDAAEDSVRVYDDEQILDLLRRTQELERQKGVLCGFVLIVLGIASSALSRTTGGTDVQDFLSGILMGLSVAEILAGIWAAGKKLLKQ